MCLLLEALLAVAPLVAECAALRSPARSLASHLIAQATLSAVRVRPTTQPISCTISPSHTHDPLLKLYQASALPGREEAFTETFVEE